ncbi:MAG: 1-acyl-sn-glycerol-3-phosphate acyltransferase [Bacilli bacterium]|nr:1-acyl-sn-glycerol-3-phosphate acyltransferase [Bacilli bacterium]
MKIIYLIIRWFVKITGLLPFFIILKPRKMYASEQAKKDYKQLKNGAILCANHTHVFDYFVFLYDNFFKLLHTLVADCVYKYFGVTTLNNAFGNIKVKRDGSDNFLAFSSIASCLKRNGRILIFPEGKCEKTKGKLENFSNSVSYLSLNENKPIIPIYIDGNYGVFKRVHFIIGEAIYPNNNINDISDDTLSSYTQLIKDKIKNLKSKLTNNLKYKIKKIFTLKYWVMDFIRITSIPIFYIVFITKKYYVGNRKKIKKALKYNALIVGNHLGPCDQFFIYQHFLSRRIKIIANEGLFNSKSLVFALKRSGVIKYHRDSMNYIDIDAFKEAINTLDGNGVVGLFPEGHINFDYKFDDNIRAGASMLSLLTNSPIIPFVFVNQYKYWRVNRVVLGNPIYPKDYVDASKPIDTEITNKFNDVIYEEMSKLFTKAIELRKKYVKKERNIKPIN